MKSAKEGVLLMNIYRLMRLMIIMLCMFLMPIIQGGYVKAAAPGLPSQKRIFFMNSILKAAENEAKIDSLINLAKSFIGVRYVYGGASPEAFDCSGLTMYVMGESGIDLPHSASGQSQYGTRVAKDELIPGDLVFFATFGGKSITHAGLYIGDNCFIHAASNGVSINNLDESYYKRCYVTAVRLIE